MHKDSYASIKKEAITFYPRSLDANEKELMNAYLGEKSKDFESWLISYLGANVYIFDPEDRGSSRKFFGELDNQGIKIDFSNEGAYWTGSFGIYKDLSYVTGGFGDRSQSALTALYIKMEDKEKWNRLIRQWLYHYNW